MFIVTSIIEWQTSALTQDLILTQSGGRSSCGAIVSPPGQPQWEALGLGTLGVIRSAASSQATMHARLLCG